MSYTFPTASYRARCINVVDGDTVDLVIDAGFHVTFHDRFRLYGVNTYEMNAKDLNERTQAQRAKDEVIRLLLPSTSYAEGTWPLRVETHKGQDSFGRWLAKVFVIQNGCEVDVCNLLLFTGLAKPYMGK